MTTGYVPNDEFTDSREVFAETAHEVQSADCGRSHCEPHRKGRLVESEALTERELGRARRAGPSHDLARHGPVHKGSLVSEPPSDKLRGV